MREIVHLQVGQCGNQIGSRFWEKICQEHSISNEGECTDSSQTGRDSRLGVYFTKASDTRYVPRAILVDLECGTGDAIKNSPIGNLFKPDNYISGKRELSDQFSSRRSWK
uniref:Tubulin beta chain (Trinotate prediction) n=1 Tax=Henneguya salminicola TaxID=69463 RepID=A0A6G3MGW1_HENSL